MPQISTTISPVYSPSKPSDRHKRYSPTIAIATPISTKRPGFLCMNSFEDRHEQDVQRGQKAAVCLDRRSVGIQRDPELLEVHGDTQQDPAEYPRLDQLLRSAGVFSANRFPLMRRVTYATGISAADAIRDRTALTVNGGTVSDSLFCATNAKPQMIAAASSSSADDSQIVLLHSLPHFQTDGIILAKKAVCQLKCIRGRRADSVPIDRVMTESNRSCFAQNSI